MPATVRYNTLRLLMVLVIGAIAYVLGARGLAVIMIAFFVSLPLSFILLARWRHEMIDEFASGKVQKLNPVRAVSDRIDAANASEDEALDAADHLAENTAEKNADNVADNNADKTVDKAAEYDRGSEKGQP